MKLYIITGTTRGLGRAFAEAVASDPRNRLVTVDRHDAGGVTGDGVLTHLKIDLANPESIPGIIAGFFRNLNRVSAGSPESGLNDYEKIILINNAGMLDPVKPLGDCPPGDLIRNITVNLIAPAVLINEFIRHTDVCDGRREIITISSGAARHPHAGWSAYCSTKTALEMLCRVVHTESETLTGRKNLKQWTVAPGVVDTGMQTQIRETPAKDFAEVERFIKLKADGRLASPETTAAAILAVEASDRAENGANHDIRDFS